MDHSTDSTMDHTMKKQDFLIIADATGSMSCYLRSLITSLPQVISISTLTGCFSRIGVLAYRDYCDKPLLKWSGWLDQDQDQDEVALSQQPDLIEFAKKLMAAGGGDYPEAVKTALARAYELMREDAETLIFLYTDAPPHPADNLLGMKNAASEKEALSNPTSYSSLGPSFLDWISVTDTFRHGAKKAQFFAILDPYMAPGDAAWYNYLATRTNGSCFNIKSYLPGNIAKLTVHLLLAWMGVTKTLTSASENEPEVLPGELSRYASLEGIDSIQNEKDQHTMTFFSNDLKKNSPCKENITKTMLLPNIIDEHVAKKATPVQDFAKRYMIDPDYKVFVVKYLEKIIEDHIEALTLNPVLGTLWRAVCSDRAYPRRDEILQAFNHRLEKMKEPDQRANMKTWLEESYDFAGDIVATINRVPDSEKYPCVFLDPTLDFSGTPNESAQSTQPLSDMTRADLLEIGRSCDRSILRKLGTILSRLTIVEKESDMPTHISGTTTESVTKIPLALTSEKYQKQFWRILFHVIKPGTKLGPRPGALVAALCLQVGIIPLEKAAEQEMLAFKDKWNDLSTPENWSIGCLSLLLDADEAHRKRIQSQGKDQPRLLHASDRTLFKSLVSFKILEWNLETPLEVLVPWTPQKTSAPIGPLVTCQGCQYPRSVTIMGPNRKCGLCRVSESDYENEETKKKYLNQGIVTDISANTTWVECFSQSCRAQYIVYNADALGARPKCHYCRSQTEEPAPIIECTRCMNRMIWPKEYRDSSLIEAEFICPPCTSGCGPHEKLELTAKAISTQNDYLWLVKGHTFSDTSIFEKISNIGTEPFLNEIELFPVSDARLFFKGKQIRNASDIIAKLKSLVSNRKTSRTKCSLCFSRFQHGTLAKACGRQGCFQRVCKECLSGWYGLNRAGSVINTAALGCPFCRRYPAPQTLAKHGMGVHAVRDLANAVRDKGTLVYAWCQGCHTAKEFMERSCARGAPPELRGWRCGECIEKARVVEVGMEEEELRREIAGLDAEKRLLESVKPCPKCETMTMKISGCGHMKCSVVDCGVDWCYFCGDAFDDDRIYGHMRDVHGGMFGGEVDVDYEMEDWTDEE
ncbi:hypothetical protein MYU51_005593 [Penicillium brevicompactum]|uniref:uncharacterized protein n=1 Tax=Penicillium brevicompactum TaxID=5074 RepID=UPI0025422FCA|nr:uncharacterized protein N7506_004620 [Penicillium brevicompactum]KAJ5336598.1 hypothetical protein N7506_004620 [Penicillium brevicompactum]